MVQTRLVFAKTVTFLHLFINFVNFTFISLKHYFTLLEHGFKLNVMIQQAV